MCFERTSSRSDEYPQRVLGGTRNLFCYKLKVAELQASICFGNEAQLLRKCDRIGEGEFVIAET